MGWGRRGARRVVAAAAWMPAAGVRGRAEARRGEPGPARGESRGATQPAGSDPGVRPWEGHRDGRGTEQEARPVPPAGRPVRVCVWGGGRAAHLLMGTRRRARIR